MSSLQSHRYSKPMFVQTPESDKSAKDKTGHYSVQFPERFRSVDSRLYLVLFPHAKENPSAKWSPGRTINLVWSRSMEFSDTAFRNLIRVESVSTAFGGTTLAKKIFPPEHLALATHIGGGKVALRFSDGRINTIDLSLLGIDTAKLRMSTAKASWGNAVEIQSMKGNAIYIDSSVLRAFCDPNYAAELRQAVLGLTIGGQTICHAQEPYNVIAELDSLKNLSDGWDSYSAPAPAILAIENAKALVTEAASLDTELEHLEPSAMGGVGVTFSEGSRDVLIEFYNDGTAHALFSDDATEEMRTKAVPTHRAGYRKIIGEVRKHLYGEEKGS